MADDIRFNCPHCEQHLEAPPEMGGSDADCPSCGAKIKVPYVVEAAIPEPEPASVTPGAASIRRKLSLGLIVGAVALVVMLAVAMLLVLNRRARGPSPDRTTRKVAQVPAPVSVDTPSSPSPPTQHQLSQTPKEKPDRRRNDATSGKGELKLHMRLSIVDGEVKETTAVALAEDPPPPLSPGESNAVQRAMSRLLQACAEDAEAVRLAITHVPEKALPHCLEIYPSASARLRGEIARCSAARTEPDAIELTVRALMDPTEVKARTIKDWADDPRTVAKKALKAANKPMPAEEILAACQTAQPAEILAGLETLSGVKTATALAPLRRLAAHTDAKVRAKSVELLAEIETPEAAHELREALADTSPEVREAALRGLKSRDALEESDLIAAIHGMPDKLTDVVLSLMPRTRSRELHDLYRSARASSSLERLKAVIAATGRFGDAADVPWVTGLLGDSRKEVRAAAVEALAEHPHLADLTPLVSAATEDKEYDVKRAAGRALVEAGPRGIAAGLENLLDADTARGAFVEALCGQGAEVADRVLTLAKKLPESGDWEHIAGFAAKLSNRMKYDLGKLVLEQGGGSGQASILKALSEDTSAESRQVLLNACAYPNVLPRKSVGSEPMEVVGSGDQLMLVFGGDIKDDVWRLLLDALSKVTADQVAGARATLVKTAAKCLHHEDASIRTGAIKIAATFAAEAHAAALLDAVGDSNPNVRAAAAIGMGQIKGVEAIVALGKLAADKEYDVREAAAAAAAQRGGKDVWPIIQKLLGDDTPGIRAAACAALVAFPEESDTFVKSAVSHSYHSGQQEIVDAFAGAPPATACRALGSLAERAENDYLGLKSIFKLLELANSGKIAVADLEHALEPVLSGKSDCRKLVAACALAAKASPKALPVLLAHTHKSREVYQVRVTGDYGGTESDGLVSANRARLLALLTFETGYKSEGFISRTFFSIFPIAVNRSADRFGDGDRWPLDLHITRDADADLNPAIIALGGYRTSEAEARIREAASDTDPSVRRSAVWALTLRDDRNALDKMLADVDAKVVEDVIAALKLMGHRAAISALAAKAESNTEAAKAVVQLGLHPEAESD